MGVGTCLGTRRFVRVPVYLQGEVAGGTQATNPIFFVWETPGGEDSALKMLS